MGRFMCIARAIRHWLVDCVFVRFILFLLGCSVGYQRRHEVSATQDIGTKFDFPMFFCFLSGDQCTVPVVAQHDRNEQTDMSYYSALSFVCSLVTAFTSSLLL